MSRLLRLLVTGTVTLMALLSIAAPARAASDLNAAGAAARWIAGQIDTVDHPSSAADVLLALAAARDASTADAARAALEVIRDAGAEYATNAPEAAAKLVIALDAVGEDPRTFIPGTDLVALVEAGIADDGTFGSHPGPFASGLGMVALARSGEPVPTAMQEHLLRYANVDGGFGWGDTASDADATALAVIGLLAASNTEALDAVAAANEWARAHQNPDGSFNGYNLVNATAILAASLESAGYSQDAALAYLTGQQQGSGAFLDGDEENMMATTQAALMLGGVSYLDATWTIPDGAAPTPTPTSVPPSATPAPTPTTAAEVPTVTASASPTPTPRRTPTADRLPQTGGESSLALVAGAAALVTAGAGLLVARRRPRA